MAHNADCNLVWQDFVQQQQNHLEFERMAKAVKLMTAKKYSPTLSFSKSERHTLQ